MLPCRFATKDHWLVPHKESRAFKELKAWQAESGIQVGVTQTALRTVPLPASWQDAMLGCEEQPHEQLDALLTSGRQAAASLLCCRSRIQQQAAAQPDGLPQAELLFSVQVATTGQSYDETDIGYLTPSERGLMQQQGAAGSQ